VVKCVESYGEGLGAGEFIKQKASGGPGHGEEQALIPSMLEHDAGS